MAASSSAPAPESVVSSTTVQVSTIGAGATIFQPGLATVGAKGQQFLIVNQGTNLHTSGGGIQIVTTKQERDDAIKRREILARQPSYCKILNDLKEAESSESEESQDTSQVVEHKPLTGLTMKGETVEIVDGTTSTQTVVINGQQYQIVSPSSTMEGLISVQQGHNLSVSQGAVSPGAVQYTTSQAVSQGGGTVFLPAAAGQTATQVVTVGPGTVGNGIGVPEEQPIQQARKREIRLMKNREAARECRNKKKEYIKCLENRVAVLENQNKALIEELKSLKELYTGQKN